MSFTWARRVNLKSLTYKIVGWKICSGNLSNVKTWAYVPNSDKLVLSLNTARNEEAKSQDKRSHRFNDVLRPVPFLLHHFY